MSDKNNPRRRNKPRKNDRLTQASLNNGWKNRAEHGCLDKSMQSWGDYAPLSNLRFGAGISGNFSNGHRGMAKAVRGAKKYVRSRVRFHENAATKDLIAKEDI